MELAQRAEITQVTVALSKVSADERRSPPNLARWGISGACRLPSHVVGRHGVEEAKNKSELRKPEAMRALDRAEQPLFHVGAEEHNHLLG